MHLQQHSNNHKTQLATVNFNDGFIDGGKRDIWAQNPSASAVDANAVVNIADGYLYDVITDADRIYNFTGYAVVTDSDKLADALPTVLVMLLLMFSVHLL